jgi:hypothetical protein
MMSSKKKSKVNSEQLELDLSPHTPQNIDAHRNQTVLEPQGKMIYIDFRQDVYRRILDRNMK